MRKAILWEKNWRLDEIIFINVCYIHLWVIATRAEDRAETCPRDALYSRRYYSKNVPLIIPAISRSPWQNALAARGFNRFHAIVRTLFLWRRSFSTLADTRRYICSWRVSVSIPDLRAGVHHAGPGFANPMYGLRAVVVLSSSSSHTTQTNDRPHTRTHAEGGGWEAISYTEMQAAAGCRCTKVR